MALQPARLQQARATVGREARGARASFLLGREEGHGVRLLHSLGRAMDELQPDGIHLLLLKEEGEPLSLAVATLAGEHTEAIMKMNRQLHFDWRPATAALDSPLESASRAVPPWKGTEGRGRGRRAGNGPGSAQHPSNL